MNFCASRVFLNRAQCANPKVVCKNFNLFLRPMMYNSRMPRHTLSLTVLVFLAAAGNFPAAGAQFYNDWAAQHFADIPAQSGTTNDPDGDGINNLFEYVFGTDPRAAGGIAGAVNPIFGSTSGTNGIYSVEIFEREGRQPGAQVDIYLQKNLGSTNWFRPAWVRVTTNSHPSDPVGSIRENFSTRLPGTNGWFARATVQLIEMGAETAKYYVATNGSDSNSGTNIDAPFKTLAKAAGLATSGNLVYIRGGRYAVASKISLTKSGSTGQSIRIRAYPGESPVLDCSGEAGGTDAISISGNYYWLYGLVMTNAGHNSVVISGSNNIVERCVSLGARNTGFHITGGGPPYPATNLYLNCDSIRSYDSPAGGNADGFSAKWSLGPGNVFSGCRGWENSDDNWDLWEGSASVLITNCWAFRAATNVFWDAATNTGFNGNGNGFKLGGAGTGAVHQVVGCLSFNNSSWGIDQNNNADGQIVDQNTVWNNRAGAINLNHLGSQYGVLQSSHILHNNVAIGTVAIGSTATYPFIQMSNTWQAVFTNVNVRVSTNDFLSIDYTWALAPRRDDGSLPETPFLRPVPGGRLVNRGVNIGGPFFGSRPDLGAYETPEW
jgi:hypothetical protein